MSSRSHASNSERASTGAPGSVTVWKVVNVATFLAVIAVNALAGSGRLSGESIGAIANRYPSYFLPADYVFGIWSVIYLGLAAFTAQQALPGKQPARVVRRVGVWWLVSGVLNIAWVTLFTFQRFGTALVAMVALLATLVILNERVGKRHERPPIGERLSVVYPFAMYLSWISVALISNSFQYAHVVGWDGFGIDEATWSAIMMVVATALGWLMAFTKRMWLFPLVVAWALFGIGARFPDVALVSGTARVLVPLGIVGGLFLAWYSGKRRQAPA